MVQIKSITTTTNPFDFCWLRVMTWNPKGNKCHNSILPGCPMNHLYSHNNLFLPTLESAYKANTQASLTDDINLDNESNGNIDRQW